jgi:hypothetical protein
MFKHFRFLLAALLILPLCAARADDRAVVRLSFVQGGVQVQQGSIVQIDNAVINMPLFEGSTLTTAMDGQAEVEFPDGSVARLTPNSSLQLTHLQRLGPTGHSDFTLLAGLAYFELNVGQGQRFTLKAGPGTIHPIENSIFRVSLDNTPEVAVMQGSLHVDGAAFTSDVSTDQYLRFDPTDPARYALMENVPVDSWDQWNQDRDAAIAQQAADQTAVRDDSQAPNDPGWNDLDYYGNWYPVEGYGNVWTPNDVDASWDPFGYGYWGDYSGYGVTWISGYPWGWLPYHCGAWNYFPFGWGWVPGGCGLGWSPVVTVWNTPPNYHLPVWPKGAPGIIPSQHRQPLGGRLIPVDRGPAARGPWSGPTNGPGNGLEILRGRGLKIASAPARPLSFDGNTIQPLPRASNAGLIRQGDHAVVNNVMHVGVPVGASAFHPANPIGELPRPGYSGVPAGSAPRPIGRPTYAPSAPRGVAPAPRAAAPAPAPHVSAPPPAPAPAHH